MGRCRRAGWMVWAVCLVPGAVYAQSGPVYTVYTPNAGPQSRLEWSVGAANGTAAPGDVISTTAGDWQVTVEFDAVRCAVYCAYRRMREPKGSVPTVDLLATPVTKIRFQADFRSMPVTATFDPAGRGLPRANGRERVSHELPCSVGRRPAIAGLVQCGGIAPAGVSFTTIAASAVPGDSNSLTSAPLRI